MWTFLIALDWEGSDFQWDCAPVWLGDFLLSQTHTFWFSKLNHLLEGAWYLETVWREPLALYDYVRFWKMFVILSSICCHRYVSLEVLPFIPTWYYLMIPTISKCVSHLIDSLSKSWIPSKDWYRSGTVNSKVFLRIKWKFKLNQDL